jgi:hypothetical protein
MPWHEFRVGSKDSGQKDCRPLTKVYHIAHLESAHRIILDGKVRSGLVFDESKLNKERILVAWLSPNFWKDGFRYGSIRFVFDWPTLSKGHSAYWVESVPYSPKGGRILLTRNDYSNKPDLLTPYDPKARGGPWWFDEASGTHYWNAKNCLEFMVERDIEMSELQDLDFVTHHAQQCRVDCPERGMSEMRAAGLFLARLAASQSTLPPSILGRVDWDGYANMVISQILGEAEKLGEIKGDLTPEDPGSPAIARALLGAYANSGLRGDIPYIARFFRNGDAARDSCLSLIRAVVRWSK